MKNAYQLITVLLLQYLQQGCKKNDTRISDGTYAGTFTVTYSSGVQSNNVVLEISGGKYNCSGNTNRIPAGGAGSFVLENNKLKFTDEQVWTADFDWNLILNGSYNYTFDGQQLKITAYKNNVAYYKYDLLKIK
jgi:hypothetical protein